MRVFRSFLIALALLAAHTASAEAGADLRALFDAEWERGLRENPINASYFGDPRYNDKLPDASLTAIRASQAADRAALERLKAIDRSKLSAGDQLNYDTFQWQLEHQIERQRFGEHLMPINHRGGVQTLNELTELLRFSQAKDYDDWLARLRGIGQLTDDSIALMQQGVAQKRVPPKVILQRVPAQIAAQRVEKPEQSAYYDAFRRFPDSVTMAERERLQGEARRVIAEVVLPAYERLDTYFRESYLPAAPEAVAAADMPDGKAWYEFLARYYTTTDLAPGAIHELGLNEVARIRADMEKVKAEVGFAGTLEEFFQHLRSDPKFYYATPEALLEGYQAISKRIDPEIVKVFRRLPRMPYGVRPIPAASAPDTTTAYYQPGAADGSRAGYYYVNLYKPETRPKWEMMPLSLHEAVPGHHFQFALGLELPEQPMFRKVAYFVAYGEGWGLYAESLGYEMGLYDDPYDRMGQLAYDMWRAIRLVVDTGMHYRGWSRQRAIDYFKANAPKAEQDIVNEIDRYIGTPGQALAYKIGQLKILELRERAAKALGEDFDLRDFNDAVLETGSVPLAALERHIDAWIAAKKAAAKPANLH
jgi:uncharacterized protein (DUF885 family)